uniref:SUMO specific peptidase 1 n=1 Tax=Neolamprologus brichardi TaxID=32507 RepID=A0A3Q4HN00_NEOBR
MLNKICEWIETSVASLRNGVPAAEHPHAQRTPRDGQMRRKRPFEWYEQIYLNSLGNQSRFPFRDLIDTVKNAAEGVKNHSSNVAAWMKNNVSPALRNMLPTSPGLPPGEPHPRPSTSSAIWTGRPILDRNSQNETFAAPSTTLEWKTSKSGKLNILNFSKVVVLTKLSCTEMGICSISKIPPSGNACPLQVTMIKTKSSIANNFLIATIQQAFQCSSNLPSPLGGPSKPGIQTWSLDRDLSSSRGATLISTPSPSALQDNSSQDTQSSAHDGDSVIIVDEQKSKKQDSSSVPCFQAELWIKELTSMYDSRARERRRQIEEQEALAAQLLQQRLSDEEQRSPDVEVCVRVPLEKELPLSPIIKEQMSLEEKPEFPELTEEMEAEVNRVLRGGNPHEVLSEGFGLSLTRKDLQTLSNLNCISAFLYIEITSASQIMFESHIGEKTILEVVDFRKKSIMYFDSMGGNNDKACEILFEYLQQESKDKKGKELDTSGWILHSKTRNVSSTDKCSNHTVSGILDGISLSASQFYLFGILLVSLLSDTVLQLNLIAVDL